MSLVCICRGGSVQDTNCMLVSWMMENMLKKQRRQYRYTLHGVMAEVEDFGNGSNRRHRGWQVGHISHESCCRKFHFAAVRTLSAFFVKRVKQQEVGMDLELLRSWSSKWQRFHCILEVAARHEFSLLGRCQFCLFDPHEFELYIASVQQ